MDTVDVCKLKIYDIASDEWITSRRYGEPYAIRDLGGTPIGSTLIKINKSLLGKDGLTERDFNPDSLSGFQTEVKRGY